jgi:hypothetical protein
MLMREMRLTPFEQVPVFHSEIETDIDESLFWSYVRGVNPGYWGESTKGFPTDTVLRDMGLAVKVEDELFPTVGGLLLFGLNDRVADLMPRADLQITRYSGSGANSPIVEQAQLQGNLFRLFDGAFNFIRRYADLWDARPSRKTRELQGGDGQISKDGFLQGRASYHLGAIVEALTNSLAHRDWSARDRQARINICDDAIEFINPSQLPELSIISLRYGVSQPHSPRLKSILTSRHYGLQTAHGGVPMICAETINFARRAADGPTIANGEFRLKLHGLR